MIRISCFVSWRWTVLLLFFLLLPVLLHAQTHAEISGTVTDAGGSAVAFATVTLHRAADSVLVKSEFTDEKGGFRLEGVAGESLRLSVAQVGFVRFWTEPFVLPAAGLTLPTIRLKASAATNLKEVKVVGQKPLFEHLADRTVVNVEGSMLAAGASSLDVLKRSPGVTVDNSDNLALRGRQGVLVLLDGKRVPMTGEELANLLRGLPADQLRSIELITNPPAKYDAQGSAGIIAINLKKDQRLGTNATLNGSYGHGRLNKWTGGLSFNHRRKKLNVFGSYSYADRIGFVKQNVWRDLLSDGLIVSHSERENLVDNRFITHAWKAGLDYNLTSQTLLGVAVNGLDSRSPQFVTNSTQFFDPAGQLTAQSGSTNDLRPHSANLAANLNLKHTFAADSSGRHAELTADADYARYNTHRLQTLTSPWPPAFVLDGDQTGELIIQSGKVDYVQPLPRQVLLEAGAKVSYVTADNDASFLRTVEQVSAVDTGLTNRFRYTENINAAYLTLSRESAKGSVSAGLRAEQTIATGHQDIHDERFSRNYCQLFPSASLRRKLSERHALGLSLSRRIDRPTYGQLNPFRSYIDATWYRSGNKDLLPQTSYNLELTETFREKYSATLGYSIVRNSMVDVAQPESANSQAFVSRNVNLSSQHYYSLTLTAPLEITKGWTLYANVVAYYNHFIGSLAGTSLNSARPAFSASANSMFTLGHGWTAELNASYQSREIYGFESVRSSGDLTAGVQKLAFGGKGTLKLSVADILYTGLVRSTFTYDTYVHRRFNRYDSRVATISFTYRLGNTKVAAARRRSGGAEEEKRRASGG